MSTDTSGSVVYRRLLGYVTPYWLMFVVSIVGMSIDAGTQAAFAYLMKPMLDSGLVDRDPFVIKWFPLIVIIMFVIRGVGGFMALYGLSWVGRKVIRDLREAMFGHLVRLPSSFYDNSSSGQIISMFTYNVEQLSQASSTAITVAIRDGLTIIFLIGLMLYYSPTLTLTMLILGPVVALIVQFISRRFRAISTRIQNSMGDVTHVTEEAVEGHKVVKTFAGQEYEAAHFAAANESNRHLNMKMMATNAASAGVVQLAGSFALAVVIYMATHDETITVGTFMSFIAAMMMMLPAMKRITGIAATLQRGIAAADSVFELLDLPGEPDSGTREVTRAEGHLEYRNVTKVYDPDKGPVLSDVSFEVPPGKVTAIVGRSGSGKSSLISLIPRFYDPTQGAVLLDGHDVREYRLEDLRRQISLVSQDVTLFNDSVRRNIAYGGLVDANDEEVMRAARAAFAMEFIDRMPEGLDTLVGENGVLLSGGQRQRLAIARALLRDSPILIMDEATSSLDTQAEAQIRKATDELIRDRTTIVIAHRLSTVENADQVIVMDDGRVVEQGTHQSLLSQDGFYAALYRMQFHEQAEQAAADAV